MSTERLGGYEHGADATRRATASALARVDGARSIVLVEGISDQVAVETLAGRLDRRLAEEGIVVVPIGGAHAVKHFVPRFSGRPDLKLSGLCDRSERDHFARALADDAALFVCDADLEDELIRSVDKADVESVLAAEGDLGAFRTLQKQPAWRDQPFPAQMHRWLRSVSGRSRRYARLLVLTASLDRTPGPLVGLVEHM